EREDIIDYGFDFYAAQSVKPQGIMLAWMDMWDRDNPSAAYGFAGMLTCPRKLSIQNGRLSQAPIVHGEATETLVNQPEIKTTMFIGSFEWELHHATSFKILLNKGDAHCTSVEGKDGNVIFDRSRSGVTITGKEEDEYSKKGQRVMPLSEKEDHKLVVVIDKYSVELFLDGQAMTNAAYRLDGDDALELYTDAEESVFRKRVLPS
ncbi:MAG: GH32 C-terminal domain-containing protein, partial [Bacilli bacterium]|nr:GH32 C-terminal domain-containing protein [Bacilli bacterium]